MSQVYIPVAMRRLVIDRAKDKCEYCLIHQGDVPFSHQIEHPIPLKHNGPPFVSENLALACLECNRYKGSDIATFDPMDGELTPLFNPRKHSWSEHFLLENAQIVGQTRIGRATVNLLRMNDSKRILQRQLLIKLDRYPPTK